MTTETKTIEYKDYLNNTTTTLSFDFWTRGFGKHQHTKYNTFNFITPLSPTAVSVFIKQCELIPLPIKNILLQKINWRLISSTEPDLENEAFNISILREQYKKIFTDGFYAPRNFATDFKFKELASYFLTPNFKTLETKLQNVFPVKILELVKVFALDCLLNKQNPKLQDISEVSFETNCADKISSFQWSKNFTPSNNNIGPATSNDLLKVIYFNFLNRAFSIMGKTLSHEGKFSVLRFETLTNEIYHNLVVNGSTFNFNIEESLSAFENFERAIITSKEDFLIEEYRAISAGVSILSLASKSFKQPINTYKQILTVAQNLLNQELKKIDLPALDFQDANKIFRKILLGTSDLFDFLSESLNLIRTSSFVQNKDFWEDFVEFINQPEDSKLDFVDFFKDSFALREILERKRLQLWFSKQSGTIENITAILDGKVFARPNGNPLKVRNLSKEPELRAAGHFNQNCLGRSNSLKEGILIFEFEETNNAGDVCYEEILKEHMKFANTQKDNWDITHPIKLLWHLDLRLKTKKTKAPQTNDGDNNSPFRIAQFFGFQNSQNAFLREQVETLLGLTPKDKK